jgi:hypothetical protein
MRLGGRGGPCPKVKPWPPNRYRPCACRQQASLSRRSRSSVDPEPEALASQAFPEEPDALGPDAVERGEFGLGPAGELGHGADAGVVEGPQDRPTDSVGEGLFIRMCRRAWLGHASMRRGRDNVCFCCKRFHKMRLWGRCSPSISWSSGPTNATAAALVGSKLR